MVASKGPDFSKNLLFYGDNLDVLRRHIKDESVDLIYLDPPFNSNRSYNVLFKHKSGSESQAQIEAFDDTWTWTQESEAAYSDLLIHGSPRVSDGIEAMRKLLGENDVLAYLVMMAARLVEMQRVLKPTGSLYLHCDPVASHYLKIILDAIFGPQCFVNEITWQRTFSHGNVGRNYGSIADTILFYARPGYTWNQQHQGYSEEYVRDYFRYNDEGGQFRTVTLRNPSPRPNLRFPFTASNGVTYQPHPNGWSCNEQRLREYDASGLLYFPTKATGALMLKQYLDSKPGVKLQNIWTDIPPIGAKAAERLGYPTQKPVALLERIIAASSNEGDVVLDPFCGCGTTIDAAQRLRRRWIGIDVTFLAVDLIDTRLRTTFGQDVAKGYEKIGIPRDLEGARALFDANAFDFERWAVSLVNGTPNEKQVGDKGSDGVIRFPLDATSIGRVIVSVKGGAAVNPAMVRELAGTVDAKGAQMGVLIVMDTITPGMKDAAQHSGTFKHPITQQVYPKVQIVSVAGLFSGSKVSMPSPFEPYLAAQPFVPEHPTLPGFG